MDVLVHFDKWNALVYWVSHKKAALRIFTTWQIFTTLRFKY